MVRLRAQVRAAQPLGGVDESVLGLQSVVMDPGDSLVNTRGDSEDFRAYAVTGQESDLDFHERRSRQRLPAPARGVT